MTANDHFCAEHGMQHAMLRMIRLCDSISLYYAHFQSDLSHRECFDRALQAGGIYLSAYYRGQPSGSWQLLTGTERPADSDGYLQQLQPDVIVQGWQLQGQSLSTATHAPQKHFA